MPQVSVILPCYNGSQWIEAAIESVLTQRYQDFELIIIDDGSTDNSVDMIKKYLVDNRVRFFCQANLGFSSTINVAIKLSRSNLVSFIGQDDLWLPNKLQLEVNYLDSHPEISVVYSNYFTINLAGAISELIIPEKTIFGSKYDLIRELFANNFLGFETVLVRKHCFDAVGLLDEQMIGFSDHDLWLRLVDIFNIAYLNRNLVKKRMHDKQISTSKKRQVINDEFLLIKKAIVKYPFLKEVAGEKVAALYYELAIVSIKSGEFTLARKRLLKVICHNPFNLKCVFTYIFPSLYPLLILNYKKLKRIF